MMLLLYFTLILLVCYYFFSNGHLKKLGNKIPGPKTLPIIGNSHNIWLKGNILDNLRRNIRKSGKVTRIWYGPLLVVYLTDPDDIETVSLNTADAKESLTLRFLSFVTGEGLLTSTGQVWKHHRKVLNPAFHFNILQEYVNTFSDHSDILFKILESKADGRIFDILPYCFNYAFDTAMDALLGVKVNAQTGSQSEYLDAITKILPILYGRLYNPLAHSNFLFELLPSGRKAKKYRDIIQDFCTNAINSRRHFKNMGKDDKLSFLDLLLVGQQNGNGFTDKDIIDEVTTIVLAGQDTTATTLGYIFYCLAKFPDIQEHVYDEINNLFEDTEKLTLKGIQSAEYLDMFIKEVLRMYTPVPFLTRKLINDVKIKDYVLPKGCTVQMYIHIMHNDPNIYENPNEFKPERFSFENCKARHPYAFMPFNLGPRSCIGKKFATIEVKVTLIKLIKKYKVMFGENIEAFIPKFTIFPTNGINIRLEKR